MFQFMSFFSFAFDSVDNAGTRKRKIAEEAGRVGKEEEKDTYLDLPEGEHASEASIEVEFRGEVTDLNEENAGKLSTFATNVNSVIRLSIYSG